MNNLLWSDLKVNDTFIVKEDPEDCLDDIINRQYKIISVTRIMDIVSVKVEFSNGDTEVWSGNSKDNYYLDQQVM